MNGKGTPLSGDRSVFDVDNFPLKHASDIASGVNVYHTPPPGISGTILISNGDKWIVIDPNNVDHGDWGGLDHDDHTQYWNDIRGKVEILKIRLDEMFATTDTNALNSSTMAHGLLRKLSGNVTDVLRGDGTWGPGGSSSTGTFDVVMSGSDVVYSDGDVVMTRIS